MTADRLDWAYAPTKLGPRRAKHSAPDMKFVEETGPMRISVLFTDAARKVDYASKHGKVDVQIAQPIGRSTPRVHGVWRSIFHGVGSTLGVAQVRRPAESPEDALRAVKHELSRAFEVIKGRD